MSDQSDILTSLQICDLANQWPNLKGLHDKTMAKLQGISTADADAVTKLGQQLQKAQAENSELVGRLKEALQGRDEAEAKVTELEEKAQAAVVERESFQSTPTSPPQPHINGDLERKV